MKLVYNRSEALDLNKNQNEYNEFAHLDHLHSSIDRHLTKITTLQALIATEEEKLSECYTAKKQVMAKLDGGFE